MFVAGAKTLMLDSEVLDVLRLMKEPPFHASDTLDTPRSELDALDKRIHSVEQILNVVLGALRRDRALLVTRVERCRAMYAPVRILPRDILVRIFDLVVMHGGKSISDPPKGACHFRASRNLSTVCYYWRDIVLSSPSLWSNVFLELPLLEQDVHRVETCLAYSRNHPLNLHLGVSVAGSFPYVLRELGRCRRLYLYPQSDLGVEDALRSLLPTTGADLHRLEEVVVCDGVEVAEPANFPQPFLHAPVLTRAMVSVSEAGYLLRMPPSLTHYRGNFHDASDYDILLHCPNLVEVHFMATGGLEDRRHPQRIRHDGLRRIIINRSETFDHLELPNLSECVIFCEKFACRRHASGDCFPSFLRTSRCTLTHLKKYFTIGFDDAYKTFTDFGRLAELSSVTTLDVVIPHLRSDRILSDLSDIASFPLLGVLGIHFRSHIPHSKLVNYWGWKVEAMLQSRQSSSRPLVGFYGEYRLKGSIHADKLRDLVAQKPALQQLEMGGLSFLAERPISFEDDYREC